MSQRGLELHTLGACTAELDRKIVAILILTIDPVAIFGIDYQIIFGFTILYNIFLFLQEILLLYRWV